MFGGFVMGSLSSVRPATYLYIGTQFWYGCVIPSCYLINSSDTKSFIMDQGWLIALRDLYKKHKPKKKPTSHTNRESGVKKVEENCAGEVFTARTGVISGRNNLKHDQNENGSKQDTFNQPKNLLCRGIVLHELEYISDNDTIRSSPKLEMNHHRTTRRKHISGISDKISKTSSTFTNQTLTPSSNQEKNNPTILLPNQVDYS